MTPALSNDLRHRLVSAAEGGASRRSAAKTGLASHPRARSAGWISGNGTVMSCHGHRGGDNRSHRMEAFAAEVLDLADETPDIHPGRRSPSILKAPAAFGLSQARGPAFVGPPRHDFQKTAHAKRTQRPDVPQRRREARFR